MIFLAFYLIVEYHIDDWIPAYGTLGEEEWDGTHCRRHRQSGHLDETDYRVRHPGINFNNIFFPLIVSFKKLTVFLKM
jgi:hypothetical protein